MPKCRDNFRKRIQRRKREEARLVRPCYQIRLGRKRIGKAIEKALRLFYAMADRLSPIARLFQKLLATCYEIRAAIPPAGMEADNGAWLARITADAKEVYGYADWCHAIGWHEQAERITKLLINHAKEAPHVR